MSEQVASIRRALISVSDKTGLEALAQALGRHGVEIVSTGGTAAALRAAGVAVREVADLTGAPEMFDGRVKTLHPMVHGGLLYRRGDARHEADAASAGVAPIDLLVVNLYPFEETVAGGAFEAECIENIDIGGPAMIRAAAKNHQSVCVLVDPADYSDVIDALDAGDGGTPLSLRRRLAATAYARTAAYDAAVAAWFAKGSPSAPARVSITGRKALDLRYGENPHQSAAFYAAPSIDAAGPRVGVATATQQQGKELSYNNLNDTDAAFELVAELARFERPACVIVKHANPCGAALGDDLADAYRKALACDPTSAFGGVVAFSQALDGAAAAEILKVFTEVVIAPGVAADAAAALADKSNLRLLTTDGLPDPAATDAAVRPLAGGFLLQDRDARLVARSELRVVTKRAPSPREIDDLLLAWTVAKHVKSNAIVYAKEGATVGVGAGQMSRVDSARIAAWKARDAAEAAGLDRPLTEGSVVASDAFFPFADGLMAAAAAGATAAIQPGGSMRDAEVIAAADEVGLAMVFTGVRHFRH